MPEQSTSPLADPSSHRNITDLLARRAADAPDHAAFDVPTADPAEPWRAVTTGEFEREVAHVAKGLIALGLGPGDRIAIMAPTRYEWAITDLAAWYAGAVVVPVYESSSAEQITNIVTDAEIRLAVTGDPSSAELVRQVFAETGRGDLGVWTMDAGPSSLLTLAGRGTEVDDPTLERRRLTAALDDAATIVYTSGTTGEPKGAVLTHRNFLGQVLNIAAAYREVVREDGNTVIFLPLAHVLARGLQLICLASGMRIAHVADTTQVVPSLAALRPTFLVVVPRVLEKIRAAAGEKAAAAHLGRVWAAAEHTAVEVGATAERSAAGSLGLRVRRALFDRIFYARLRRLMGGRLAWILSGGAALEDRLSLFFRGLGVPVIEGYGLTETTAPLTGNLPGMIRSGTVGRPLPGSTVRIAEDGEILARGVGVFAGYRDERHNAEAFRDGFFRTGDLGRFDDVGNLVLTGRVKDVIVTSSGKTVTPGVWEQTVELDPLVAHAVVVGEGRPYLSALLVLDPEQVASWASAHGVREPGSRSETDTPLAEIVEPRLREALSRSVDAANARVSRAEQIRRFTPVLTDLADPTLITPTMKIKRGALLDRGTALVDALYS